MAFAERPARVVLTVAWFAAGACWVAQLFVPWTTRGVFATSSMMDGVRLVRSGVVDEIVPGWAAVALLAMPAAGLVVGGAAGFRGTAVEAVRVSLSVAVVVLFVLSFRVLTGADVGRLGLGGWLTVAGIVLAVAAVVITQLGAHASARRKEIGS